MSRVAAEPSLYAADGETPVLRGTRCRECARTFFPPLGIGCEVCGSDQLVECSIPATGAIHSVATVHVHFDPSVEAPFHVAEIQLESGPLIRGVLEDEPGEHPIGRRVEAIWSTRETNERGEVVLEPVFVFATGEPKP